MSKVQTWGRWSVFFWRQARWPGDYRRWKSPPRRSQAWALRVNYHFCLSLLSEIRRESFLEFHAVGIIKPASQVFFTVDDNLRNWLSSTFFFMSSHAALTEPSALTWGIWATEGVIGQDGSDWVTHQTDLTTETHPVLRLQKLVVNLVGRPYHCVQAVDVIWQRKKRRVTT